MIAGELEVDRNHSVDFSLYLISDRKAVPQNRELLATIAQALEGGVQAVQLRDKDLPPAKRLDLARQLRLLTRRHRARLIINGAVDIALAVEADGVHLGASSMPVAEARRRLGAHRLIGYSAHHPDELRAAHEQGADFATFSPVFFTPSKADFGLPQGLEKLAAACRISPLPIFALGGIGIRQVREVRRAGAHGIALISAILGADNPRKTAEELALALRMRHPAAFSGDGFSKS